MSHPRGLSEDEAAAWEKLAATVTPLSPPKPVPSKAGREGDHAQHEGGAPLRRAPVSPVKAPTKPAKPPANRTPPREPPARPAPASGNLDSHWDRRIKSGGIEPDFTLDLHGHGLDAAYQRLMAGVAQARAMGARTILLVTGKPRPVHPADRGQRRGAIRAKVLDWLAASEHADAIAAIRKAHRHHGGDGALYLVLRRSR